MGSQCNSIMAGCSYLYASTHVRTWKRMRVYNKRECRFNSTKSRACDWSTKQEVKIGRLNTSICTATLLFSQPFFAFTTCKFERVNFKQCTQCVKILPTPHQTVIVILIKLIKCALAFKYHIPRKLGLFYLAFYLATVGARK